MMIPPEVHRQREEEGHNYGEVDELILTKNNATDTDGKSSPNATSYQQEPITFNPDMHASHDGSTGADHYYSGTIADEPQAKDSSEELMQWHYCLGHLPFSKLQHLAKLGEISWYLAKVPVPKCA